MAITSIRRLYNKLSLLFVSGCNIPQISSGPSQGGGSRHRPSVVPARVHRTGAAGAAVRVRDVPRRAARHQDAAAVARTTYTCTYYNLLTANKLQTDEQNRPNR